MTVYEYKVFFEDTRSAEDGLNTVAQEGWRLHSVVTEANKIYPAFILERAVGG